MGKKLTTEEFIVRAKAVHGDKYDYSLSVYVDSTTKVKIACPAHGIFIMAPSNHINQDQGCKKCGYEKNSQTLRQGVECFVEKAKTTHGDKYDYSKVKYSTSDTPVEIVCPDHGSFQQRPVTHLRGSGCTSCGYLANKISQRSTTEEFIRRSKAVHHGKYDYSEVDYTSSAKPVSIICPTHGVFPKRPNNHIRGEGCPACIGYLHYDTDSFITKVAKIHNGKYDYSRVAYKNTGTKIEIICPDHGSFMQTPNNHLIQKQGCPRCGGTARLTNTTFIERSREIHGVSYDYSITKYTNWITPVTIVCPTHGTFHQKPREHLDGSGCRECGSRAMRGSYNKSHISRNKVEFLDTPCSVYLFKVGDLYKIGMSKDPHKRLLTVERAVNEPCRIVSTSASNVYDSFHVEEFLHNMFSDQRLKHNTKFQGYTEIFELDQDHVTFVTGFLEDCKESR